jgi:DNA-binding IclR family transcriptional regulator
MSAWETALEQPPTMKARQPHAIHSALAVLDKVAQLGEGVTARELSFELGLPRATAYRILALLVEDGYLKRTSDGFPGFALGAKVAGLASVVAPPARLVSAAREVLEHARVSVRGGVHVALCVGGRMVLIDSDPDFPFSDSVGLAHRPERFAMGRLLLAERAIAHPRSTQTRFDVQTFGATRQSGERSPGLGCLALPIRDNSDELVGALGFSGPRHRIDDPSDVLRALVPVARELGPLIR